MITAIAALIGRVKRHEVQVRSTNEHDRRIVTAVLKDEVPNRHETQESLVLSGQWRGDKGDLWTFCIDLEVSGPRVKGKIRWTLVECPPSLPFAKLAGKSGYEFVRGLLEVDCLTLRGYRVSDRILLAASDYTIVFGLDGKTIEGTSQSKDWGGGTLKGTVITTANELQ